MIRSRCSWDRPPWSAAASRPRPDSASARSSTSPRVRANTSVAAPSSRSRIRPERGRACRPGGRRRRPGGPGPARRPRPPRPGPGPAPGGGGAAPARRAIWPGDRGREQRGLADLAERAEDPLEVVGEAHVEHLVGLVEHDRVDVLEAERAAVEVVDGAARRRDDDVDAPREPVELGRDRLAAVDRHDPDAEPLAVLVDRLGDLHRELAGRREHERRRPGALPVAGGAAGLDRSAGRASLVEPDGEALEDRQRERGGLAGPGGRLGEEVGAARAAAGSRRAGSAWAPRSRGRRASGAGARRGRARRTRATGRRRRESARSASASRSGGRESVTP